jgi:putative flippase GtrA
VTPQPRDSRSPEPLLALPWKNKFIRFLLTGGVSAFVDVGTLQLALSGGLGRRGSVTLGFAVGLAVNFVMHKFFTFSSKKPISLREVAAFGLVVLVNYGITLGVVEGLAVISVPVVVAKVASLPLVAVVGFVLSRRFVFV